MIAAVVEGASVPKQQITVGDFTYGRDSDGNIRRWPCDHSSVWAAGSGCGAERVLSEHDIPHEVRHHFGLD